jgi:hypothetical protein
MTLRAHRWPIWRGYLNSVAPPEARPRGMIGSTALLRAVFVAAFLVTPAVALAQVTQAIRGTTRDSTTGQPTAGALVELRGPTFVASVRSDDAGAFRFFSVPAGEYRLTILRIGYSETARTLRLANRDTSLAIALAPLPRRLGTAEIRANVPAIYGTLGGLPNLLPVVGARVQVLGAKADVVSDSTGAFFVEVPKPGMYFVRIVGPGFAEERFPVEVPKDRAIDASRILDPGATQPHPALEHLYRELDRRIGQRGTNSAVIPGSELRAAASTPFEAIQNARSTVTQGLRLGTTCLFVNGIQKHSWLLQSINVDDIEMVELYALRGNLSGTLVSASGLDCGNGRRPTAGYQSGIAGNPNVVQTISIWLKR